MILHLKWDLGVKVALGLDPNKSMKNTNNTCCAGTLRPFSQGHCSQICLMNMSVFALDNLFQTVPVTKKSYSIHPKRNKLVRSHCALMLSLVIRRRYRLVNSRLSLFSTVTNVYGNLVMITELNLFISHRSYNTL